MGTKVWNFLLPDAGSHHQVRVEKLGSPGEVVFIDDKQQPMTQTRIFVGPGNRMLELKEAQAGQWTLLVNGLIVEDYSENKRASKDETLRELRSKPEGSYMISTEFDAVNLRAVNIIRKFRFTVGGAPQELHVSHHDCIWQVIFNGRIAERLVHRLTDNAGAATCSVEASNGARLDACLRMKWLGLRGGIWRYSLAVNNVEIPHYWSKVQGDIQPPPPLLDIAPAASSGPPEAPAPAPAQEEGQEPEEPAPQAHEALPQGVSYDALSGAYQANIRSKAGRFVFLGEFRTAEEAHACYLEAVPIHCPDKLVAPEVLS